jgi:hypothetical protein
MQRFVPLAIVAALTCVPPTHARRIDTWSYERLLKEADVVVVGAAISSKDSKEAFKNKTWDVDFLGVDTTFAVAAVLKGKVEGDKLTLLHYRLKHGIRVDDGPLLVAFRMKGIQVNLKEGKLQLGRPAYLLFLKKRADGRFEAVSGQIDPALAVREVYRPLPEKMGKDD